MKAETKQKLGKQKAEMNMALRVKPAVSIFYFLFSALAFADLTAVVTPGYQFPLDGSVAPTFQDLNLLGMPSIQILGTVGGSNIIAPGSLTGVSLSDTLVDGTTMQWNSASPRQLAVKPGGLAGWGLLGTGTNLTLYLDTNEFQLATNSIDNTNTFTTPSVGNSTAPAFWLTLQPQSLLDTNISPNAFIQTSKFQQYSNSISVGTNGDRGSTVWLGPSFAVASGATNVHNGTNIAGAQLQLNTFASQLFSFFTIGTGANVAHGLTNATGALTPVFVRWVIVNETADNSGYFPPDEVSVDSLVDQTISGGSDFTWGANQTNVFIIRRSSDTLAIYNKTNGAVTTLNTGNWQFKCYARP